MGSERVGEFTVYKKGWLATLHRNPVKTSFCSATYRPKAHRPIYRDLGALVHSKYLHPSVRHVALIVGAWSRSSSSGSTGEQQSGAPDASSGDGMIITNRAEPRRPLRRPYPSQATDRGSKPSPLSPEPEVRIHLPPAGSRANHRFLSSGVVHSRALRRRLSSKMATGRRSSPDLSYR